MDYVRLAAEIQLPAYQGLSDAAIAEQLNVRSVPVERDVPIELINRRLIGSGVIGKVRARLVIYENRLRVGAMSEAEFMASAWPALSNSLDAFARLPSFETSTAAVRSFVGAVADLYVAEGCMTAQQRTQFLALWTTTVSRAEQIGCPNLDKEHIAIARGT